MFTMKRDTFILHKCIIKKEWLVYIYTLSISYDLYATQLLVNVQENIVIWVQISIM